MSASAIYDNVLTHNRYAVRAHSFRYRVSSLLLDLDELDELSARLRLFSRNRANLFSFYDTDHGPGDGRELRAWLAALLAEHGIDDASGPVRVLCFPRLLGYVFNPLSAWFCHRSDGELRAVVCEVHNTFGERHSYVLSPPVAPGEAGGADIEVCREKTFYVSPFFAVAGDYRFRIQAPGVRQQVEIEHRVGGELMLRARLAGERIPLTDRALLGRFFRMPLMTFKVIAAIHWQALRLWLKGVGLHGRLRPPNQERSR